MPRPDKAVEPSMEEILASIRKIISEEPIGTRPDPSRGQSPPDAVGRFGPGPAPPLTDPHSSTPSRGSDMTGSDPTSNAAHPVGSDQPAEPSADKRWSLARPVAAEPRFSAPGAGGAGAPRQPVADTGRLEPPQSPQEVNGHAAVDAARAAAPNARQAVDADAALSEARAKIERHLGRPAQVPADRPLVPGLKSIRDAEFRGAQPEGASKSLAGGLMARMAAAAARQDPAARNEAPPVPMNGEDSKADAPPKPAAPPIKDGAADIAKAPPEPAQADANGDGKQAPAPAESRPAESKPVEHEPAASDKTPVPATDRARALEDAVAEMLRPMLREWLDANLPRLAQQVLREEMAKSPLPSKDSTAA